VAPSAAVNIAGLTAALPAWEKEYLLAPSNIILLAACLAAKEVPPVKGAAKSATIVKGSEAISIPASFTSSAYSFKPDRLVLVNFFCNLL